ncbi:MAG: ABC transporter substrate-binding protein [Reinekea forsetii]|jgi:multiple sugar transport system substrate-binding protein|uniref:Multiple sugar ABC transporter, substrate-binding protein n=1 Tax=Reinekea forsetii TaxID=1336806 RepID=A0A2K8KTX3_9GAMM|nr:MULTISPECIES: ABC transporter substrate-binding protein [Reinekea]ATX77311.1 multiple sugar ABC transporter, substrate-binding protein [Reinekea forsetii]MDO7673801.1 ABC transporter substrate-binding protein [Reinekea forsetii]|tara:strand:+ start:56 stop:1273 length:1218 start_codon:yes stop_codon:yes gene_type:complete
MTLKKLVTSGVLGAAMLSQAYAGTLVINSNQSDPAPKQAWADMIAQFETENPDIDVKVNQYDHEGYKSVLRNWLVTSPPDVVFWFAGNRMKFFVDLGLFEDVSDVWANEGLNDSMSSTKASLSVDGKKYGVPYSYYQWGIYYNKGIFDKLGLSEPQTWDEFIAVCDALKANAITPITIGTKYLWTAAGWFDYLNMRTNGLDYHIDLMDGKIPYTDAGVRNTFANWKQLVDGEYFLENHASYSWQEAQPPMFNGEAAMYLMGNFLTPNFPEGMDFDFFPFPIIDPSIGRYEDAPTDTVHIPSRAKNKADARKFLAYVALPENQTKLNMALNQLPPNKYATAADNKFLTQGNEMLGSADGTAQFYDRDTDPAMASEGMKGFQEFMVHPERLDKILDNLERVRQRIFK